VRRAAVLGSPVAHSLSPALHAAAYRSLGLEEWRYEAVEVREGDLATFLDGLDHSWAGLSLTMPLKRAVVPLLDEVSPLAGLLGVVNTVTFAPAPGADPHWSDPGLRTRRGDNTDVAGIVEAVREAGAPDPAGGLVVLGAGATALSALAAGRDLGFTAATAVVRDPGRAGDLVALGERIGVPVRRVRLDAAAEAAAGASLVVSTLPAGAADDVRLVPAPGAVLLDVVYDPWPTALAAAWQRGGGAVVPGTRMLLHQAAAQVELMTGRAPDLAAMAAALP
jgi:shikimate dehydrogenase